MHAAVTDRRQYSSLLALLDHRLISNASAVRFSKPTHKDPHSQRIPVRMHLCIIAAVRTNAATSEQQGRCAPHHGVPRSMGASHSLPRHSAVCDLQVYRLEHAVCVSVKTPQPRRRRPDRPPAPSGSPAAGGVCDRPGPGAASELPATAKPPTLAEASPGAGASGRAHSRAAVWRRRCTCAAHFRRCNACSSVPLQQWWPGYHTPVTIGTMDLSRQETCCMHACPAVPFATARCAAEAFWRKYCA